MASARRTMPRIIGHRADLVIGGTNNLDVTIAEGYAGAGIKKPFEYASVSKRFLSDILSERCPLWVKSGHLASVA